MGFDLMKILRIITLKLDYTLFYLYLGLGED